MVTIGVGLEAVVLIVSSIKEQNSEGLVYPVYLLLTAVVITLGLGLFQWLNAKAEEITKNTG